MFTELDVVPEREYNLSIDRYSTFSAAYWSANRVNFNPHEMPQKKGGIYVGTLRVGSFNERQSLKAVQEELGQQNLELAEIMEAFHFGIDNIELMKKHVQILIPGSLASPTKTGPEWFCPVLFPIGRTNVRSLGIELLPYDRDEVFILEGIPCLLREKK